ncbi:tRNA threonylcarbamoyladenosine biosynthesis protein TsaE [Tsukamurella pulmonis]|uniref:tRNA threonylcarbamoyladenosine biosynthesis protein TsaE n=1 Tax=Tsukamurella pulmonis TaxID=47312 RepID=A0A1H1H1K9_9ACTN|nr:tRNA (adenosine(37)-N6)-threonylcarbamoyltransferase complex ATPase subunit type 1 TsaE [Tsukamurella pulmonis]KXO88108.1 tRNA threonylcarbamoyladenosine biosynthesis protein TsaE [Tsukamurella pulmonis]KXP13076.1 tRNA threonylcarbamoyladenosine biosynthesis protein TsaE [Tsukamurella pulmonis]RDH13013.1 tRNA (adenosine(37)-N6)-threonylcarbamoyltransferase complex ATPase subunit type 1 TsaE [Tsukamurella pulmonis]SDR19269.1 tRNA threonylcarbamoyladenosine biosynthesis protein TsaE [Tsukamure
MSAALPGGERVLPEVEDTEALGRELAAQLRAGDLVILDGPLGAGKTALTRGIAAGLGVTGRVSSPTFIIAREHRAGTPGGAGLVHVDAYRLGGLDELDALDLDTDLEDCVVVVEWGEGVAERLTDRHLMVRLRRAEGTDVRTVTWAWSDGA